MYKLPPLALLFGLLLTACVSDSSAPIEAPSTAETAEQTSTSPLADDALQQEQSPVEPLEPPPLVVLEPPSQPAGETREQEAMVAQEAEQAPSLSPENESARQMVLALCEELGNKLGSVSVQDCHKQGLMVDGGFSVNNRPIAVKEYEPLPDQEPFGRVLVIGGIHGDEYSSISVMFKWMDILSDNHSGIFHWKFAPSVNPDGLLDGKAKRQNANGVDLNRNFPSADWNDLALSHWEEKTYKNPRRYPGTQAASEPEVKWIVEQIEQFDPDVVVSVHAPYHLLDYDGPLEAPKQIGKLYLHQLGVYPGSLGNYGGIDLGIPVITLELPSAGIMPTNEDIRSMWRDLVAWLIDKQSTKYVSSHNERASVVKE